MVAQKLCVRVNPQWLVNENSASEAEHDVVVTVALEETHDVFSSTMIITTSAGLRLRVHCIGLADRTKDLEPNPAIDLTLPQIDRIAYIAHESGFDLLAEKFLDLIQNDKELGDLNSGEWFASQKRRSLQIGSGQDTLMGKKNEDTQNFVFHPSTSKRLDQPLGMMVAASLSGRRALAKKDGNKKWVYERSHQGKNKMNVHRSIAPVNRSNDSYGTNRKNVRKSEAQVARPKDLYGKNSRIADGPWRVEKQRSKRLTGRSDLRSTHAHRKYGTTKSWAKIRMARQQRRLKRENLRQQRKLDLKNLREKLDAELQEFRLTNGYDVDTRSVTWLEQVFLMEHVHTLPVIGFGKLQAYLANHVEPPKLIQRGFPFDMRDLSLDALKDMILILDEAWSDESEDTESDDEDYWDDSIERDVIADEPVELEGCMNEDCCFDVDDSEMTLDG